MSYIAQGKAIGFIIALQKMYDNQGVVYKIFNNHHAFRVHLDVIWENQNGRGWVVCHTDINKLINLSMVEIVGAL